MTKQPTASDLIWNFQKVAEDTRSRESGEGFRAYLQVHANDPYHIALETSIRFMADTTLPEAVRHEARNHVRKTLYDQVFQRPAEMAHYARDVFRASSVEADRCFFANVAIVAGENLFYQQHDPQKAVEAVTWLCLEKASAVGVGNHNRALNLVSNSLTALANPLNPDDNVFFITLANLHAEMDPPEGSNRLTLEQRRLWSLAQNALEHSLVSRWESLSRYDLLRHVAWLGIGVASCNGFSDLDDARAERLAVPLRRMQEVFAQEPHTVQCLPQWVMRALSCLMPETPATETTLQCLARTDQTDNLFKKALGQLGVEDAIFEYSRIKAVHRLLPEVWKETLADPQIPEKRKLQIFESLLRHKAPQDLRARILPENDAEREKFIRACLTPPPSRKASAAAKPKP